MKYLATTFAIAFMAIGFTATPAQDVNARGNAGYCPEGQKYYQGSCYTTQAQIDDLRKLAEEGYDREQDDHGVEGDDSEGDRAAASTAAE